MKNLIYSFLLILTCAPLEAQRVTPEVVATAGETFFNSTLILEWTLGEIMTETYTGSVVLTQGFHQPLRDAPSPVARCQEMVTAQIGADGNLDLDANDLDNGSSDENTPNEDLSFGIDFDDLVLDCDDVNKPAQPVSLIVTNNVGQTDTCFTMVTVEDNIAPEITCQDAVLYEMGENGGFDLTLDNVLAGIVTDFEDNCAAAPSSLTVNGIFSVGCNPLNFNSTIVLNDGNGQQASCSVNIDLTDPLGVCNETPIANCQPFTAPFDSLPVPTILLNANVFDDGSSDDRSVYTLVYSDATDRQESTNFDCSTTGVNQGQTFTAGQTGLIQSIKVRAGAATNTTLRIRSGNSLSDTVTIGDYVQNIDLFFGQHSGSANLSEMLLDEPFPVVAGQMYTFVLSGETTLSRSCPGSPAYPDGRPLLGFSPFSASGDEDLTFEVNIIGPNVAEFPNVGGTLVTVFAVDDQGKVSEGCQTFINPDQPLPVAWLSFGANAGAKTVDLHWETSEEPDNAGFHLERSAAGTNWSAIGEVAARTGPDQSYAFTDAAPLQGTGYYRLRQTDFNGQTAYSPVATVEFYANDRVTIFPNPASDIINLQLPGGAELHGLLSISGREINVRFEGQDGFLRADVSGLPTGVYFLRVRLADGTPLARRLVVR